MCLQNLLVPRDEDGEAHSASSTASSESDASSDEEQAAADSGEPSKALIEDITPQ